ncbi:hypothetical protein SUGI_0255500 [Cryptomeria japonica]|nr:hypothetical protein SUGI_0255500 [Cryptomeria japonica]
MGYITTQVANTLVQEDKGDMLMTDYQITTVNLGHGTREQEIEELWANVDAITSRLEKDKKGAQELDWKVIAKWDEMLHREKNAGVRNDCSSKLEQSDIELFRLQEVEKLDDGLLLKEGIVSHETIFQIRS